MELDLEWNAHPSVLPTIHFLYPLFFFFYYSGSRRGWEPISASTGADVHEMHVYVKPCGWLSASIKMSIDAVMAAKGGSNVFNRHRWNEILHFDKNASRRRERKECRETLIHLKCIWMPKPWANRHNEGVTLSFSTSPTSWLEWSLLLSFLPSGEILRRWLPSRAACCEAVDSEPLSCCSLGTQLKRASRWPNSASEHQKYLVMGCTLYGVFCLRAQPLRYGWIKTVEKILPRISWFSFASFTLHDTVVFLADAMPFSFWCRRFANWHLNLLASIDQNATQPWKTSSFKPSVASGQQQTFHKLVKMPSLLISLHACVTAESSGTVSWLSGNMRKVTIMTANQSGIVRESGCQNE